MFIDALFHKLRVDGRVKNVAAYLMVGIDLEGEKECLYIWLGQSESAKYWLSLLNGFKNRGVNDVLIFAVDGGGGFPEAIRAVYPQAEIYRYIVHQVRNSLAQMARKDRKGVASCLRSIFTAPAEEACLMALAQFGKLGAGNTRKWLYPGSAIGWFTQIVGHSPSDHTCSVFRGTVNRFVLFAYKSSALK